MNMRVLLIAAFAVLISSRSPSRANESATDSRRPIRLNFAAFEYAQRLLAEDHAVADTKGHWRDDRPSTRRENEFLRTNGFSEYAKWHLGVDLRHPEKTKEYYRFPFGDFENVHRCGLLAVKSRAHEFGYADIEAAADKLLAEIELKNPRH